MAEGGYLEGILDLKHDTTVIIGEQREQTNGKDGQVQVNHPTHNLSEKKKDEKDYIFNYLGQELDAAVSGEKDNIQGKKNSELNSRAKRPTCDLEGATAELQVVQEAHRILVAEKNALILALQSGSSMVKVKHKRISILFKIQILRVQ